MQTFDLALEPRTETGKAVRHLRSDGVIPVIIYGLKKEPQMGQVSTRVFEKLYAQAGESSVVNVTLEKGTAVPTIIHGVSHDPVRDTIQHVDFLRIDLNKEIEATVSVKHVGLAPAVKEFMGVVITVRDTVHVKCLPKDLVHEIELDLSVLTKIGDTIHVKDITPPAGITILDSPDAMLLSIAAPRAEEVKTVAAVVVEGAAPVEGTAAVEGAPAAEGAAAEGAAPAEGKEKEKKK